MLQARADRSVCHTVMPNKGKHNRSKKSKGQAEKKVTGAAATGGNEKATASSLVTASQPKPTSASSAAQATSMKPTDTKSQPKPTSGSPAAQATSTKPAETKNAPSSPTKMAGKTAAAATSKGKVEETKPKETTKPMVEKPSQSSAAAATASAATVAAGTVGAEAKKHAADPFDALAGTLPAAEPATKTPKYTGPEVKEKTIIDEKGVRVGEREDTLPPEYRAKLEKGKDLPAPKEESPMDEKSALDALAGDFVSPATASAVQAPVVKRPQASQQAKIEDISALDTLAGDFDTPAAAATFKGPVKTKESQKKAAAATVSSSPKPPADTKAKTDQGSSISMDALSALGDTLGAPEPVPEPPKPLPKDIVKEKQITSEKGVLVGEREDSLPPEYRAKLEKGKDLPAPKEESPMDEKSALDALAGDFVTPTASPAVQAPVVKTPQASKQTPDQKAALDALAGDFVSPAAAATVNAPVKPPQTSQQKQVNSSTVPPTDKKNKVDQKAAAAAVSSSPKPPADKKAKTEDFMSMDALSALGDTLGAPEPTPEPPKPLPKDIVKEKQIASEKGVLVGEREDSLPPEYRAKLEKGKDLPAPKEESPMDEKSALDALAGDFVSPTVSPAVQAPVVKTPQASKQAPDQKAALDAQAGDFVSPAAAATVNAPVKPPKTSQQKPVNSSTAPPTDKKNKVDQKAAAAAMSSSPKPPADKKAKTEDFMSMDALSALGDTLGAPEPTPEPPKPLPKDIVKEKQIASEKGVLVGEREDSLPPEYRAKLEKGKDLPAPKEESPMDEKSALDALAGDFVTPSASPAVQAPVVKKPQASKQIPGGDKALAGDLVAPTSAATVQASVVKLEHASRQMSTGTIDALDALSDTLKDDTPVPEPKPVPASQIVKEKKVVEEKIEKMGERDDSLPPEYRPSAQDVKEGKKQDNAKDAGKPKEKPLDDKTALDALAGDFNASTAVVSHTAQPSKTQTHPGSNKEKGEKPEEKPKAKTPVKTDSKKMSES
ncbi:calpastatin isoform X3 [Amia ocellicauda]|uniref:calpastatin isoform X3 n=1 Tax=Amia ocellicauda TaxID=2972642 RepID=UPI0034640826